MRAFNKAWQILKTQDEYIPYEHGDNLYYNDDGTPRDPRINPAFDEEDLMDDTTLDDEINELRNTPGFYDGVEPAMSPEEIKAKEREGKIKQSVADYLQSQKLAGEPMSIAWQVLKEESVGEKYGLPPGFSGDPEVYNRAREEHNYNRIMDEESIRGENQALENVGEVPSLKELMDKIMRGEQLTRHEQMMLQRF